MKTKEREKLNLMKLAPRACFKRFTKMMSLMSRFAKKKVDNEKRSK
jgi:hypothetical protein